MRLNAHSGKVVAASALALLLAGAAACGKESGLHSYSESPSRNEIEALVPAKEAVQGYAAQPSAAEDKRKVIVSHELSLEVREFAAAYGSIVRLAETYGGHTVSTSQRRNGDGSYSGRISMRLPPGKVGTALGELRKLGTVVSETSSGEDITDQYYDLEARLKNARASEARLLNLMERQTGKLSDVLDVERELTRVRGDIESMEGRLRGWDVLTRTVAVTVNLSEPPRSTPIARNLWNPLRTAFPEAARYFVESLRTGIVLLGMLLPWLAVAALAFYLLRRVTRRHRAKKPQA